MPHASPTAQPAGPHGTPAAHTAAVTVYWTSAAPSSTLGSEAALIDRRRGRPVGALDAGRRSLFTPELARLCRGV